MQAAKPAGESTREIPGEMVYDFQVRFQDFYAQMKIWPFFSKWDAFVSNKRFTYDLTFNFHIKSWPDIVEFWAYSFEHKKKKNTEKNNAPNNLAHVAVIVDPNNGQSLSPVTISIVHENYEIPFS